MDCILAQPKSDVTKRNLVFFLFKTRVNLVVLYRDLTISSFNFLFVRVFHFVFLISVIEKTQIGAAIILWQEGL